MSVLEYIKPIVTKVRDIGINGDVYMRRYYTRYDSLRFHEILRSDADRDLHDHPWDFTSTLLEGSYVEVTPQFDCKCLDCCKHQLRRTYVPGDVLVRKAEDLHRLEVVSGPVWTAVTVGPTRRQWGYETNAGWVPWDKYLVPPAVHDAQATGAGFCGANCPACKRSDT